MTIKEIAKLAGVSIATVSKIVNKKDETINIKTREKVLEIVKKYNYTPYGLVKQNSEHRSFILAIIFSGKTINENLFQGVMKIAQNLGYSVMVYLSENNLELELQHLTSIVKNRVEGVLWEGVTQESFKKAKYLEEAHIKFLPLNFLGENDYSIDYKKGIYYATKELLKRNHRDILFLNNGKEDSKYGFKKALFDNNIIFNEELLIENTEALEKKIIEKKITGLIIENPKIAKFIKNRLESLKYKIPSDISIITLSDKDTEDTISFLEIESKELGEFITKKIISLCENSDFEESFNQDFILNNENTLSNLEEFQDKKILVIGSINLDITLNVNEIPTGENTIIIKNHTSSIGGKGLNQAIGVNKLGIPVSLIGKVGDDLEGKLILSQLISERLSIEGVEKEKNSETGKAFIQLQQNGKSTIAIFGGANEKLSPLDIEKNKNFFKNSGYCLISTEIPEETVKKAIILANKYKVKVILKPSSQEKIHNDILGMIDIFILNRKEAEILCGNAKTFEEKANFLLKKGVKNVIITLGEKGCYLRNKKIDKYYPAIDFPVVDTTGASDAFIATLGSYLIKNFSLENAIKIATYAAGFSVLHQGSINGMIDKDSLESYIYKKEPEILKNR